MAKLHFIKSGFICLFLVAFAVWVVMSANITIWMVDEYVNNPHRTFTELAVMMPLMWVVYAFWVLIVIIPSFSISQSLMSLSLFMFARRIAIINIMAILFSVTLCALVSFYCYDFIVPSFRWYTDTAPDWVHGITYQRFRACLHTVLGSGFTPI